MSDSGVNAAEFVVVDADEYDAMRKDAERYRLMRKITLEQVDDTQDEFDAEFDRQINRSPEKP